MAGSTVSIRVTKGLQIELENIRKKVAKKIKKDWNLDEVSIGGTLASQIATSRLKGNGEPYFKVIKIGSKKGRIKVN